MQVASAPGASTPPATAESIEKVFENTAESRCSETEISESLSKITIDAGMPEAVIGGTLLIIGKNTVSLVNFLEFSFGIIPLVMVGVILESKFAKGFFYLVAVGIFTYAENFIIIPFWYHILSASVLFFAWI